MNRSFGEDVYAYHLQDSGHALLDSQRLVENGDQQVRGHGYPDLRLHRVLAEAVEGLYRQVLLDPLEEQLDLPASLVDLRDDESLDLEVVREEGHGLPGFRIHVADAPEVARIESLRSRAVEADGLVGPQARGLVHAARSSDVEAHVRLRPGHEEGPGRVDAREATEVDVSTIHYIEGSGLEGDPVQGLHVVDPALRDGHERGDGALQVDQRVDLHRRLGPPEPRPGEESHAQVHDRGVQGV